MAAPAKSLAFPCKDDTVLGLSEDGSRYMELGCFGRGETIRSALLPGLAIPVDSLFPSV